MKSTETLVAAAATTAAIKYGVDKDDLHQDIWVRLLSQNGNHYNNRSGIYTIAHSIAIEMLRKRKFEVVADLSETVPEEESEEQGLGPMLSETTDGSLTQPEAQVIETERMEEIVQHVKDIVNNAQPAHKDVLEAYYLKGLAYQEAAEALGLPIGTVKSRLSRARAALGGLDGALRAWREFAYPEAREPDKDAARGHSGALLSIWQG